MADISNEPYFVFYREGVNTTDRDHYPDQEFDCPSVRKFATKKEMNKWIDERLLDERTAPTVQGESYAFEWFYKGKEEFGEEA